MRQFDPLLEKELKAEIEMLFDFFDTNKDGKISMDELRVALKSYNPLVTQNELNVIMKMTDKNQNNEIDREEFMQTMLPQMK